MAVKTRETTLADLTPDAQNANRGTERGAYMVEESLRQFGAGRSILVDREAAAAVFAAADAAGLSVSQYLAGKLLPLIRQEQGQ